MVQLHQAPQIFLRPLKLNFGENLNVGLTSLRRGDGFGISLTEISLKIEPEEMKCLLKLFTISVPLVIKSFAKI